MFSNDRLRQLTREKLADKALRAALANALGTVRDKSAVALEALADVEQARETASRIRSDSVLRLKDNLETLEAKLKQAGTKVIWASDGEEACAAVLEIAREQGLYKAIFSKSMLGEEIGLEHALVDIGVKVVQTDLGERIVQLAGDRPSHITAPCLHMSAAQVGRVLAGAEGMPYTDDATKICKYMAETMRPVFLDAHLGLSGANLAVARTGHMVMVENEGNVRLGYTLPKVHVVLLGIEKLVSSMQEAGTLLSLLPRMATGQGATSVVSLLAPAPLPGQTRYVVLVDNGRSRVFGAGPHRDLLKCIRCGACMNVCPVYEKVGGHAYGWVYPGPIGIALAPFMAPPEIAAFALDLCALCGACNSVCPVKIPLERLIALGRATAVQFRSPEKVKQERKVLGWWARAMGGAWRYKWSHRLHKLALSKAPESAQRLADSLGWSGERVAPAPAATLFRNLFRKL